MVHPKYYTLDGEVVPSVTQVLGLLNKPWLVSWAYRMGGLGEDINQIRNDAMKIGSEVHDYISWYLAKTFTAESPVSETEIKSEEGKISFQNFQKWMKEYDPVLLMTEKSLVSEKLRFGGTLDAVFRINGRNVLVDFKTSKQISDEYWHQLAAYGMLLDENGTHVDDLAILRLPKDSDSYEYAVVGVHDRSTYLSRQIFQGLLTAYVNLEQFKEAGTNAD